jgi:hypothetical protein
MKSTLVAQKVKAVFRAGKARGNKEKQKLHCAKLRKSADPYLDYKQ